MKICQKKCCTSCLLLPSIFEPWGLVIHEATSAGLSVICSNICGASVHLVQDRYNGYNIKRGDAVGLGEAMLRYSNLSHERRNEMSNNSYNMLLQFTPKRGGILVQVNNRAGAKQAQSTFSPPIHVMAVAKAKVHG